MPEAPADFACEYLERKGDPRPHRGYYYCNQLAIEVRPGEGRCSAAECPNLQPAAVPAVPGCADILSASPAVPAAPPTSTVGGATGPDISPPKEPAAMPAKTTTRKVDWTAPAQSIFPDAPQDLTLRAHVRNLVTANQGTRGYVPALARKLSITTSSILSAIGALKPKATPAAPSNVKGGGAIAAN